MELPHLQQVQGKGLTYVSSLSSTYHCFRYIAVAERGDRGAQVNVFDLKSFRKRKNLVNTESTSKVGLFMRD
jgi:hypothetical protein